MFSHSVMSDSLWPHELQHARLPCPSPSPRSCSNSPPLSRWCHTTTSSSVVPFSCFLSVPDSGSFPVSWLLSSGAQSIGASASASVLSMNIQGWFPLGLTKGFLTVFSKLQFESVNSLALSLLYGQLSHSYMTTGKTIALTIWTFVHKVMSIFICGLESRQIGSGQTRDGKSECRHSRNQRTEMDWNGYGGVSGVSSSCGARGRFLPRHDEDLREPPVWRQRSQISMCMARGARHGSRVTGGD